MKTDPHVLIVDDDRDIRDLLTDFLKRHGLRVSTARDAGEMTAVLSRSPVDVRACLRAPRSR